MDRQNLKVCLTDVWALCDALHTKLTMLGEVSPSFKDGYLVAAQHLSDMVGELEDELERAKHDETMLAATAHDLTDDGQTVDGN